MAATAPAPAGEASTMLPRRHHAVELELNACGVECCPHDAHKGLVAVASYLHQPGDEDTPQSRVGQLYLYDLRPSNARGDDGDAEIICFSASAYRRAVGQGEPGGPSDMALTTF
mgnify:CR=1 FL=1